MCSTRDNLLEFCEAWQDLQVRLQGFTLLVQPQWQQAGEEMNVLKHSELAQQLQAYSQTTAFLPFIIFHDHLLMVFVFFKLQVCLEACNICTWCNDTHVKLNCSKTNKLSLHFSVHVDWETAKKQSFLYVFAHLDNNVDGQTTLMILGCRQTTCGFQKGPFIIHKNGFQSAVI